MMDGDTYEREIETFRKQKDHFMQHHAQSPLTRGQQRAFDGLNYFPVDPNFRYEAELEKYDDPDHITMDTSTGDEAEYVRLGKFGFEVDGQQEELHVYQDPQRGDLFLPFRDGTTGEETYDAGRYLEVERRSDDKLEVDFNRAYNPFCAYNDQWRCPFPPLENWIDARIEAGEKKFKDANR